MKHHSDPIYLLFSNSVIISFLISEMVFDIFAMSFMHFLVTGVIGQLELANVITSCDSYKGEWLVIFNRSSVVFGGFGGPSYLDSIL